MQTNQLNVVHESEAQRRHSRLSIPCVLTVTINQHSKQFHLLDLSASGFAVNDEESFVDQGKTQTGKITFNLDGVDISIDVKFKSVGIKSKSSSRMGCEFVDLGLKEISVLRLIITKFLSGEIVSVNDVLATLNRDNYAKQRKTNPNQALPLSGKIKAVLGTLGLLLVGLFAFGFIVSNLYQNFFLSKSLSAIVSIPYENVMTPLDGVVKPLVKNGQKVSPGQAIATIDSPLLEMIPEISQISGLAENELSNMVAKRVGGVIESQCNCIVIDSWGTQGKYRQKGDDSGLKLAASDATPEVTALFEMEDLARLQPGLVLTMHIGNNSDAKTGVITDVQLQHPLHEAPAQNNVLVTIKPEETWPIEMINRPVEVSFSTLFK